MALLFPESVPSGLLWKHLQCVLNNSRVRDDSFLTRTLFLFWVRLPFVVDAPCALEGVEQPPWPLSTDAPSSPVLTTKKKKKKHIFRYSQMSPFITFALKAFWLLKLVLYSLRGRGAAGGACADPGQGQLCGGEGKGWRVFSPSSGPDCQLLFIYIVKLTQILASSALL